MSCDVCQKSFTSKKYMTKHIKNVHQSKTYSCDECEKTFSTSWNMTNHRKSAHENELKKFSICEKPVRMTNFVKHEKTCQIKYTKPIIKHYVSNGNAEIPCKYSCVQCLYIGSYY